MFIYNHTDMLMQVYGAHYTFLSNVQHETRE